MTTQLEQTQLIRRLEAELLRQMRDVRFAATRQCPRCHGEQTILWGSFSGRQRYRCQACGRTFSDLTATPLAYSKRLSTWPQFLALFHQAATVRRCAAALKIHSCTAFRWRHAVLEHTRAGPFEPLTGTIELAELTFALSFKGSRRLQGDARRRSAKELGALPIGFPRTRVIILWARAGGVSCGHVNEHLATRPSIARFLKERVSPNSTVVCRYRRASAYGSGIRRANCKLVSMLPEPNRWVHLANVKRYSYRYERWMLRFHGVATKYLDNYLAWHSIVDGTEGEGLTAAYHRVLSGRRRHPWGRRWQQALVV